MSRMLDSGSAWAEIWKRDDGALELRITAATRLVARIPEYTTFAIGSVTPAKRTQRQSDCLTLAEVQA